MRQSPAVVAALFRHFRKSLAAPGVAYCTHGAPSQLCELPAVPGTLMRVVATSSNVDIKARQLSETCALQAPAGSQWSWSLTPGTGEQRPILDVSEAVGGATAHKGGLIATIPDKWISVDVHTSGQSVSVAKLVEANLNIKTEGGDVTLGQVRAFNVAIDSIGTKRCGQLKSEEVSGSDVQIRTGTARVTLRRLVGQKVYVELEGKPLSVRSLYAENIEAWTGEGSIDLGNLDVSGVAALNSEGGDITVHSLDGNANITSAGGDIEVHLHSKVGSVQLDSGGGSVRVAVSPQASVDVLVKGTNQVTCTDAGAEQDGSPSSRVFRFRPSGTQEATRYGQLSEGRVVVEAGDGEVEIVRVGWMEALKQRLAQAAP